MRSSHITRNVVAAVCNPTSEGYRSCRPVLTTNMRIVSKWQWLCTRHVFGRPDVVCCAQIQPKHEKSERKKIIQNESTSVALCWVRCVYGVRYKSRAVYSAPISIVMYLPESNLLRWYGTQTHVNLCSLSVAGDKKRSTSMNAMQTPTDRRFGHQVQSTPIANPWKCLLLRARSGLMPLAMLSYPFICRVWVLFALGFIEQTTSHEPTSEFRYECMHNSHVCRK